MDKRLKSDIMDEEGFIFTTDATLALVVMIVFTASVVTYGLLPVYQGETHQHLEALADSALETMEQDGTLREAAVEYSNGNTSGAESTLQSDLNVVIPDNVGYKLTMSNYNPVSDSNGVLTSNDVVTKVKVISGPQEGWMGRAYYKQEAVQFQTINSSAVTTLWNFHNYLKNFDPWHTNGLDTDTFWGGTNVNNNVAVPINFSAPGPVNSAQFLLGSAAGSTYIPAYGADVIINGQNNYILNSSFLYLYTASTGAGQPGRIYNYMKNLSSSSLNNGLNNFYIKFNATDNQNMPWFSIIANYTTSISVPLGVANDTIPFTDIAGIGRPGPGNTGILYNLDSGTTSPTAGRSVSWINDLQSAASFTTFDTSTPFELRDLPNVGSGSGIGSAVASTQDIYLPPGNRLFDAFTVVNAFGGEDGAIVQVLDSSGHVWTAFSSFGSFTNRNDGGYGNVPGIINIAPYLTAGHNKVRIITWDDVPSSDYDLVGLESCYSKITYSKFPIRWDTFAFNSFQNSSTNPVTTETQNKPFNIDQDAQSALLFVGVGTATRNIQVKVTNSTGGTAILYPTTNSIPYVIDLVALDTTHVMSTQLANGTTVPRVGNYTLTVTATPSFAYQSGDGASSPNQYGYTGDATIFSGTRISVIYPKFLQNVWATGYANNPQDAATNAVNNLIASLNSAGYSVNATLIRNTTLYTGDVPNAIPVRLDLWTQ